MVVARNEETGQNGIFPVSAVMKGQATDMRWLTLADNTGRTSRLGLTGGHPMFVVGKGWLHADEISAGDRIRNADFQELTVLSVEVDTRPQIVHNLEVADAHTYFAGEFEAWGHNAHPFGPSKKGGVTGLGPNAKACVPFASFPSVSPSTPAKNLPKAMRDAVQRIGDIHGCHVCGSPNPGTKRGRWIPDHQPSLKSGASPLALFPHCLCCSRSQGGRIRQGKLTP